MATSMGFHGRAPSEHRGLAIRDLRSRDKPHPATLWGGLITIASQPAQLALSGTALWLAFARWATGLPG